MDLSDNTLFVSYGSWQNIEDIKAWTESAEFKNYMSRFSLYGKSIKINIIKPLVKV